MFSSAVRCIDEFWKWLDTVMYLFSNLVCFKTLVGALGYEINTSYGGTHGERDKSVSILKENY